MSAKAVRTRDLGIYLKESRYDEPKEVFKLLASLARDCGVLREGSVVSDFGCAAGEFLHYLSREIPEARYFGYDVVPALLEKAREHTPKVVFSIGSVLDKTLLAPASTDIAFMSSVHSIFDEFEPCLANLLHWTRKGGRIFIFGVFNPYPVDVWVTFRTADHPDPAHREAGWNMFSKASVSRYLEATLGVGKHTFIPFEMPFDLPPNSDDPVRSWTFLDGQNRRLFTNGLSLICNLEILEIRP